LTTVYLGEDESRKQLWAVEVSDNWKSNEIPDSTFVDIRPGAFKLSQYESGIIAQATAMLDWNSRDVFCPSCGSATKSTEVCIILFRLNLSMNRRGIKECV
jgi:NAD+ diphosphatase